MNNQDQIDYWNGPAGERWARDDAMMERILRPVTEALIEHAPLEGCRSALDVGCGGGSQSLMLAEKLGAGASVLGVDISAPMLGVAKGKLDKVSANSATVEFIQADASQQDFEAGSFDLLFSRFGVMFFNDPTSAFSQMRKALTDGGRLAFCCWQSLKDNAWSLVPLQAALQHIPPPESPDPHAPGPFAFADPQRVTGILEGAGFTEVKLQSFNSDLRFAESDLIGESVRQLAEVGPIGRLLQEQPAKVKEKVYVSMEDVLAPYFRDGALIMPVAIWFVTARAA